jgi:hypothetical protein
MEFATQLAVLAAVTVVAAAAAFGMVWAFLQGAFRLMQPATKPVAAPVRRHRLELVHGTRAASRAFARS